MSYAQPSPPTIHTLFLTRASATLRSSRASGAAEAVERRLEPGDPLALRLDPGFGGLIGSEQRGAEVAQRRSRGGATSSRAYSACLSRASAHAEAELRVVLEQRVGPGRPASVAVDGPRRGGLVAAVDGRAAGGVGDDGAVAEELAQELEVRGLAAAGAGAGELEQGLEQLDVLDLARVERVPVHLRQVEEELPVRAPPGRGAAPAASC